MNEAVYHSPLKAKYFTKGTIVLTGIALIGFMAYMYRFVFGLDAATNLTDQFPWGIWIAIDVASGVALAAGGFTTAALVHIFHREDFHKFVRPALLTAMLGYTFVVLGLLADLGRYYNVWHPMLPSMWQGNSVLFEVGMCVTIYLSVLYIEFFPVVIEKYKGKVNLPAFLSHFNGLIEWVLSLGKRLMNKYITIFIIAGVVLSFLHQSSLGTLMLIAPHKIHPLWSSPISPLLFLLSAIAVGFPMVIFESILSERSFGLKPAVKSLSSLSVFIPILLGIYLGAKVVDLTLREVWQFAIDGSLESIMFMIEMIIGVVAPIVILSMKSLRNRLKWLFLASSAVIAGVLINRINVFLIAYNPLYASQPYFPSVIEIMVTIGLISCLVLVYRLIALHLPIISEDTELDIALDVPNQKLVAQSESPR